MTGVAISSIPPRTIDGVTIGIGAGKQLRSNGLVHTEHSTTSGGCHVGRGFCWRCAHTHLCKHPLCTKLCVPAHLHGWMRSPPPSKQKRQIGESVVLVSLGASNACSCASGGKPCGELVSRTGPDDVGLDALAKPRSIHPGGGED